MSKVYVPRTEWPPLAPINESGSTGTTLDASDELFAWCGPVWWDEQFGAGPKNITKVGWRHQNQVIAGGSGATLSLQDISAAASPIQPDGTPDQTVAVTLAASAGFFKTNALSAVRAVNKGDMLAAVLGFDISGRLGSDTIVVDNLNTHGTNLRPLNGGISHYTGTWATIGAIGCLLLEFDDGTFGTIGSGAPFSSRGQAAFNSGSSPNRRGLRFRPQRPLWADGAWALVNPAGNSSDFDMLLYEDGTLVRSYSIDATAIDAVSNRIAYATWGEIRLSPNSIYDLEIVPTTANNVTVYEMALDDANHRRAWPGGTAFSRSTRTDTGSWTETTNIRPALGFLVSAVENLLPASRVQLGM